MFTLIEKNSKSIRLISGVLAITFYLIYAIYFSYYNNFLNMLWVCHTACLIVGIGLLGNSPNINGIGFLWLIFGVPMWILNVLSGESVFITSIFTHVGGLVISIIGLIILGLPRFSWIVSSIAMVGLFIISKLITPPELNINLAFSVWKGWETMFPSYFWYITMLTAEFIVISFIINFITRKLLVRLQKKL